MKSFEKKIKDYLVNIYPINKIYFTASKKSEGKYMNMKGKLYKIILNNLR